MNTEFSTKAGAHESNASSPFGFGSRRKQFVDSALIVIQRKHHIEAAQRHSLEHFIDAREFGFFGFQKLTPSRRVKKQVANLYSRPCWMRGGRQPASISCPSASTHHAVSSSLPSRAREVMLKRETELMLASASPRNPRLAIASRSSSSAILLVAWRLSASARSSLCIPAPSSRIRSNFTPPCSTSTSSLVAPASRLFSSSSFTTEAGRSTTSPGRNLIGEALA